MPVSTLLTPTYRLFDGSHRNRNPLPSNHSNPNVDRVQVANRTDISSDDAPIEASVYDDYTPLLGNNLSAPVAKRRRKKAQAQALPVSAEPHIPEVYKTFAPTRDQQTKSTQLQHNARIHPAYRRLNEATYPKLSAAAPHADISRQALTEEERLQDPEYRKKIKRAKWVGYGFALIIAAIDGINTAVAASTLAFIAVYGLPVIILIGVCGFMFNRVVYWRTVPDMLKQIFVDGLFTGLSPLKKVFTSFSFIFAATLGAGFAALAFKSLCVMAGMSMVTIFTLNPAVGAIFATLAVIYFVANTSLFLKTLASLIRNDAHKQMIAFFKRLFTPDAKQHPLEQTLTAIFQILFTIIGFSLAIIAAYALLGKLANSIGDVLHTTASIAKESAILASKVVVFGIASVARFLFSIETAVTVFSKLGSLFGSLLFNTGWMLTHWQTAKPRISAAWNAWKNAQTAKMTGRPWDDSWKQWRADHADTFKQGTLTERIACYNKGFLHAVGELGKVKKFVWFAAAFWFLIHIPAIVINAVGQGALGAGGGNHLQDISHQFGIPIDAESAAIEAMLTSGAFSATLGMNKYIELNSTPAATAAAPTSKAAITATTTNKAAKTVAASSPTFSTLTNSSATKSEYPPQDSLPTSKMVRRRSRDFPKRSTASERQPLLGGNIQESMPAFSRI